jgi:erythronate-4-phosphate dehydrogenase
LAEMLPQVDAISLHVPLTQGMAEATFHLIDEQALQAMRPDTLLINSARGAVIAETALLADFAKARAQGQPLRSVVLDVFEHEPRIAATLLDDLALATPHIAGYTLEGKARGTEMVYQAFCQWRGETPTLTLDGQLPSMPQLFDPQHGLMAQLPPLLARIYPIHQDDAALRACVSEVGRDGVGMVSAADFDRLRKDYPLRREWASFGDRT